MVMENNTAPFLAERVRALEAELAARDGAIDTCLVRGLMLIERLEAIDWNRTLIELYRSGRGKPCECGGDKLLRSVGGLIPSVEQMNLERNWWMCSKCGIRESREIELNKRPIQC